MYSFPESNNLKKMYPVFIFWWNTLFTSDIFICKCKNWNWWLICKDMFFSMAIDIWLLLYCFLCFMHVIRPCCTRDHQEELTAVFSNQRADIYHYQNEVNVICGYLQEIHGNSENIKLKKEFCFTFFQVVTVVDYINLTCSSRLIGISNDSIRN